MPDSWLLYALDADDLAGRLGVDGRTVRRWRTAGPPGPAALALRLLDGDLGAHHAAWAGWWIDPRDGHLVAPNGETLTPGDAAAWRLERQRLAAALAELDRLRAALDETGRPSEGPAPLLRLGRD